MSGMMFKAFFLMARKLPMMPKGFNGGAMVGGVNEPMKLYLLLDVL